VFDSLFPGWQQIGGVWLPLPHLLNMIPVQVDAWYRSGASGVAISVLSMATAAWALATLVIRITRSRIAAMTGATLMMANPNLLYLQSTPMTEPLLFATTMVAILFTAEWIEPGSPEAREPGSPEAREPEGPGAREPGSAGMKPGLALAAACMTRYEALPITAAIVALACAVLVRRGTSVRAALAAGARLITLPLLALVIFTINSRWTTGYWFIPRDFYVPENVEALGHPMEAWRQVREGLYRLSGTALVWPAYGGLAMVSIAFLRSRARAPLVLIVALTAAAVLPWYAYLQGHPFRIRYDVPLVVACAALTAAGIALMPALLRPIAAAAIVAATFIQVSPLDRSAPVVLEAQRDARNMEGRRTVTTYLQQHYDGRTIMMSMGSLAHYMHDLSLAGFNVRDFLHEGNGQLWPYATHGARSVVGWVMIEEHAEGGDSLFRQRHRSQRFLAGFRRVAEGGGVALYRVR
jgi:hypothetical protein